MSTPNVFKSLRIPVLILIALWVIELTEYFMGYQWGIHGVLPREKEGLMGILLAPLLHGDFSHLISNSLPFLVLSTLIFLFYRKAAIPAIALIWVLTGAAVWLFGRQVYHIGMSGVIYGMASFIFFNGIFQRDIKSIAIALLVAFVYGGMLFGVLPGQAGVSWESHLLGAFAGIFVSFLFRSELKVKKKEPEPEEESDFFFERDLFDENK